MKERLSAARIRQGEFGKEHHSIYAYLQRRDFDGHFTASQPHSKTIRLSTRQMSTSLLWHVACHVKWRSGVRASAVAATNLHVFHIFDRLLPHILIFTLT